LPILLHICALKDFSDDEVIDAMLSAIYNILRRVVSRDFSAV